MWHGHMTAWAGTFASLVLPFPLLILPFHLAAAVSAHLHMAGMHTCAFPACSSSSMFSSGSWLELPDPSFLSHACPSCHLPTSPLLLPFLTPCVPSLPTMVYTLGRHFLALPLCPAWLEAGISFPSLTWLCHGTLHY